MSLWAYIARIESPVGATMTLCMVDSCEPMEVQWKILEDANDGEAHRGREGGPKLPYDDCTGCKGIVCVK